MDVPIESSTYCYRVLQTEPKTGRKRNVKCYHKLVIVKDKKTGKTGNYIVFFIATNKYSRAHRGIISEWFNNDGNMGTFSGLKIYVTLDGRMARVNKYIDGQKRAGLFLAGAKSRNEYARGLLTVARAMKHMKHQRGKMTGATTRSENGGEWDFGDDGLTDIGNGFFWDDDNSTVWYDSDNDGDPDSVWVNEVEITPDNDDNWWATSIHCIIMIRGKCIGTQIAKDNYLTFEKVPSGTVYWLSNLTRGQEELPFYYIDGRQRFLTSPLSPFDSSSIH